MEFDYGTLIEAMHKIKSLEQPTLEQEAHVSTLMDVMLCSWMQEGRTLPTSQSDYDAMVVRAMSIVTFYSKT
ncbi:MAG: hypothetical protein RBJ76_13330 [Stenomitos frigidus ULC029]